MNRKIILKNAYEHNLKNIDLELESNQLIVFTGVSGSGKSSLAFDTLYVEGQRRYIESLSSHSRQIEEMKKPKLEQAFGICPTISIEQKTAGKNPRSIVGTMTEIYDYMRVLFARVGIPHCPISGEVVKPQSKEHIIYSIQNEEKGNKLILLAPFARGKKSAFKEDFEKLLRKGYMRVRIDGTIYHLNDEILLDEKTPHDVDVVIDRIAINEDNHSRIAESVTNALEIGQGLCIAFNPENKQEKLFSRHAYSPKSGISYPSLEPHDFSFNSPYGMCEECGGLGEINAFDLEKVIDPSLSIAQDCCSIASSYQTVRYKNIYDNLAKIYNFNVKTPWRKLSKEAKNIFLYGSKKKWLRMEFVHPHTKARWTDFIRWKGVIYEARKRYEEAKSDHYRKKIEKYMHRSVCPLCHGERLKPYPRATTFKGKRIGQILTMTVKDCLAFFSSVSLTKMEQAIIKEILKEIISRLTFLTEVGLSYLSLNRSAPTLSGGEAQRVRLASQIGSGLVGITYILDEPSIGLHHRDNIFLIKTLKSLRDLGNTVIVVEHDEDTILSADTIVDFGPGAGKRGGNILVNGNLKKLLACKESKTAQYLSEKKCIPIPKTRRKHSNLFLEIKGASHHNLKSINVKFPLKTFIAITGVSGSGKSSLITETLYPALSNHLHHSKLLVGKHKKIQGLEHIDKVIAIDQSPIGKNPRSNPATYIKLFDLIRNLFASLPESKARGYLPGRFSFNVKEGSCSKCFGAGQIRIDMDFLEDQWIVCDQCQGKRFDTETLSIYYKGKNIADILEMEVLEALDFFKNIPKIKEKLIFLSQVGMDYIHLGQPSTTLSGGEAQRIKLAKELSRMQTGNTLYILDEPSTGLHFHDIHLLLNVLHKLVDKGNTVIVIEHNLEIIKTADWIIDLGPEGGEKGGEIIGSNTPEKIIKMQTPTALALKEVMTHGYRKKIKEKISSFKNKKKKKSHVCKDIVIQGAEQNNLKHLDLTIPREKITILSGPSGSGKTSLAFDTIYAEGQRRYVESLSAYARQFVKQMPKPKVREVLGLSPAIAIEQKISAGNPRSTVGTMTEIYDFLRIVYAKAGIAHSPETGNPIQSISKETVAKTILKYPKGEKIQILAPVNISKENTFISLLESIQQKGFLRIRFNNHFYRLDEPLENIPFEKGKKNTLYIVIDRLKIDESIKIRLLEAIDKACLIGEKKLVVMREKEDVFFNLSFSDPETGKSYPEISPHTFAFNTSFGMCPDCSGLGYTYGANLSHFKEFMHLNAYGLMRYFWKDNETLEAINLVKTFLKEEKIDGLKPLNQWPTKKLHLFLNGSEKIYKSHLGFSFRFLGINHVLGKLAKNAHQSIKESIIPLMDTFTCPSCQGARLNPLARHVTINGVPIHKLCQMPIQEALQFISKIKLSQENKMILEDIIEQIICRLHFLNEIGLHYLSLDRKAPTLSGGETQRIRLAKQLGSSLTGVLYVIDEPTIGLHPHDIDKITLALDKLKRLGNTLLIVEHDTQMIKMADYILDFGPLSGEKGGHITAKGSFKTILQDKNSLTGKYLSHKLSIPIPKKRRAKNKGKLTIENASKHNLKNITVSIPIQTLTCLTGVSGSGKSTLIFDLLLPALKKALPDKKTLTFDQTLFKGLHHFDKVLSIDQNPIGHTIRSDVGTYCDILPKIRQFYASLPKARAKGLEPKHFSTNHRSGMCTGCYGLGTKKIEMYFMPAVEMVCNECKGLRLNSTSLEVDYQGLNFGKIFNTTVDEAKILFQNHPSIAKALQTLIDVGLGYLKLGQKMVTLSGGEAQRIKLSKELIKRSTGKTIYLLDEPTTGLHSDDINKLINVLHKLVDKKNTVIVIEHHLDLIKNADYIIDIGPDAGEKGGYVLCSGTPEEIALCNNSHTAKYLKPLLFQKN